MVVELQPDRRVQECSILPHSRTYYYLLFSLYFIFIIFVISYYACTDIRVMLEHYYMSFLLTTENGNLFLSNHVQEPNLV